MGAKIAFPRVVTSPIQCPTLRVRIFEIVVPSKQSEDTITLRMGGLYSSNYRWGGIFSLPSEEPRFIVCDGSLHIAIRGDR